MNVDITMMVGSVVVLGVLIRGWRQWPQQLTPVHENFRESGSSEVFERSGFTGRKIPTGIRLNAACVEFEVKARFVLLPPEMKSKGIANLEDGVTLQVRAITLFPSMRSHFELIR